MLQRFRQHLPQFSLYLCIGFTALGVDLGSYYALLSMDVWYITASVIGGILGFFTSFLGNKYFVFRKREKFMAHLTKFFLVDMANIVATNIILYVLVEFVGISEELGKIIAMGCVVLWNFVLYKLFVYT